MRVDFINGATLAVSDQNRVGTYSDGERSANVRLLGVDEGGALIERLSDNAVFRQHGFRQVRQNTATAFYEQPKVLGTSIFKAIPSGGFRFSKMQRGQSRAIAPEYQPGPGAGWIFKESKVPAPPQNNVQPWMLAGPGLVAPQAPDEEVVLLDVVVPQWTRMRLSSHVQYLEDGSGNEDDLIWILRIGGIDILNPFGAAAPGLENTGRVMRSNSSPVPFAFEVVDMPILSPGTRIQYIVRGAAGAGANTDKVAASLIGTMWGDKGV